MERLIEVQQLLRRNLHLDDQQPLDPGTELLGAMPEFDSMAVVLILADIQSTFGIQIPDDEIEAEAFLTVASLHHFIMSRLG